MNLEGLRAIVAVDDSPLEREAHARDLWPRRTLGLAHGEVPASPLAVAFPESEDQVAGVLRWASERGVPVVPWGAGSGVCGGAEGNERGITLDLKRLRTISPVDPARRTVRVQAGVIGQHLEDALAVQGWATRHSPSSIWCSTVGGWAASRSAGQFSSRYGKFEDMVRAMRVVAPARRFGTGEWADGEDLGPWVLGAEGALGVITELLVRVVPLPRSRWLRGYRFASTEAALGAMRALLQADLFPCALRLYDPVDTKIAGKGTATHESGAAKGGAWLEGLRGAVESVPGLRRHLLTLPLSLPRLLNQLALRVASGCVLIAGWEGDERMVELLSGHGHALLLAHGAVDLGSAPGEHWYAHRHEVSYKLAPIFERGGFADTMEVAAVWSKLPALYERVRAALAPHALVMAHFSHTYREGCSIYFTFAGVGDERVYLAAWEDALAAAAAAGGTVAHHHGVGQAKMAAAAREMAGIGPTFHRLKASLDPAGVLNPGRLFPPVPFEEPARPEIGVDRDSLVATLDAHAPAEARDAALAAQGVALRFPCEGPLAESIAGDRLPHEVRVLGASVRVDGHRVVLVAVPRSSAGPDPRAVFPPSAYETVTVPLVPLTGTVELASASAEACERADVRPSRRIGPDRVELRGPAARELKAWLERDGGIPDEDPPTTPVPLGGPLGRF